MLNGSESSESLFLRNYDLLFLNLLLPFYLLGFLLKLNIDLFWKELTWKYDPC